MKKYEIYLDGLNKTVFVTAETEIEAYKKAAKSLNDSDLNNLMCMDCIDEIEI